MTTTSKVALAVVAVIVLAGLGWWYYRAHDTDANPAAQYSNDSGQDQNAPIPGGDQGNTAPAGGNGNTVYAPNDTSDAALASNAASIDAQMNGLSSDTASADQSMNDQPVAQPQ